MRRGSIALVIMLLAAATALELAATRSNAQTMGEYAATINGAGALDNASKGINNYRSESDFRPSTNFKERADYRTNLYTSDGFANSTNYATSGFGNATNYKSDNNFTYNNPTELSSSLK